MRNVLRTAPAVALVLAALAGFAPASSPQQADELGLVRWERNFDAALGASAADGRPLFVLFQEVPGCATCVNFGRDVLSNKLLVEAIETEFRPVAVLNNRPGADAAILKRYAEPAWNNPVVRFLDTSGADLIERQDRVWTARAIAERMQQSLSAAGRPVPGYLQIAAEEAGARVPRRATFAMHCYWQGEACLGDQPGLISSRAGWLDGREVVELEFDGRSVSYAELVTAARQGGCANHGFAHGEQQTKVAQELFGEAVTTTSSAASPAKTSDQKYYLRHSPLRALDLTPLQAARINSALERGEDPQRWLSPSQRERAATL
jgi:hypothetical protein